MSAEEKYRKFTAFKEKVWREIKQLEQEYKRNASKMQEITDRQSDISARTLILLAKIDKEGDKYDSYCYENKVGEYAEQTTLEEIFEKSKVDPYPSFKRLDTLVTRLSKLGITLELVMNFPWVYLRSVNGNNVTDTFKSEHGFTIAFMPIKKGASLQFTDFKEIFKVIRKYSFYNARIFGGKAL
jgi:hypothetical protein